MDSVNYFLSFIEGFLTFLSPCILPLLPVYIFYLAGESFDDKGGIDKGKRGTLIFNSVAFVVGFTIVFVILGATATTFGSFLKMHQVILQKISGIIMVVFGLNYLGVFKLKFLNFEKRFEYNFKKLGFFNSVLLGVVFAFGWTPCGGQFLAVALLTAANSDTILIGMYLLLLYSLGLGIPFIVVAVIFGKVKAAIKYIQKYSKVINIISGVVLILAGILVFTGNLQYLSYYLTK